MSKYEGTIVAMSVYPLPRGFKSGQYFFSRYSETQTDHDRCKIDRRHSRFHQLGILVVDFRRK